MSPPDVNGTANGINDLKIVSPPTAPLTQSPVSSPVSTTAPGPPDGPVHNHVTPTVTRKRTPSLYSEWDLKDAAEESSDEEDEAFMTPSEGLSEVEEEDEEEAERVDNPYLDKTNVPKGAEAETGDVMGTGPSTIRRTRPAAGETKVRKRAPTKALATDFDQSKTLAKDIDNCREILTLFLRSKMKEAEDMCFDMDPDGTHLYMLSAHGIINGLKVSCDLDGRY